MTFKEFLKLSEDTSSSEKGLMGYGVPTRTRKPSDGQPFKDKLSSVAGDKGAVGGPGGGPGSGPMMGASPMNGMLMSKYMKKH